MRGKENVVKAMADFFKKNEFGHHPNILFIEDDYDLYHTVGIFRRELAALGVPHNTLLRVDNYPMDEIIELINRHEFIVWQSQYCTEIARKLTKLLDSDSKLIHNSKHLIECYLGEPRSYYQSGRHQLYNFLAMKGDYADDAWQFVKLEEDRAPWDKGVDEF